jgi:hypothetical protein
VGEFAESWEREVRRHFDFLLEKGFRFDGVEEQWWAASARYLSTTHGVEVTRSVEFDRVEITLMRLVEGRAPDHEVWLTERPLDSVLFDNVLAARAPELLDEVPSGLSEQAVDTQLRLWAELLRSAAPEFLEGDDSALRDGEQVIRRSNAASPQQVTIWLPSDASEADEARARAKAERTTPPEVRIVVRRYER